MHAKELCFASASYVVKGSSEREDAVEIRVNMKETTVAFVFEKEIPKAAELVMRIEYQVSKKILVVERHIDDIHRYWILRP